MTNFTPAFLDEVLSHADIVELIARHVELKKSGSNLMGLCPFHHEKTPSFSVSPDKQLYYCFGCGKGGGAFQFLMEHDGYAFPEAVEYLAEKAGMEIPKSESKPGDKERRQKAFDLLAKTAEVFSQSLASGKGREARDYISKRELPEHIVCDYKLGYAPAGYGFMEHHFGSSDRIKTQLESVGMLFRNDHGGYGDRFRNRLMFPIRDRRGQIAGFGGRLLADGEPKYLNSSETPYFRKSELLYGLSEHREHIRKRKQLLVVEGYMDVLMLAAFDLPVALAPLGTAISEWQIREIFRLHANPVFCFDGDRAGRQAAWRALERMLPQLTAELTPAFLYLPEGEDPDSLVKKTGFEGFVQQMGQARPVLETWLAGLKLLAGKGPEGRARMAKRADAMLTKLQDPYLRQAWRQEAESASGIRLQAVAQQVRAGKPSTPGKASLEERFLAALIQKPERFKALPDESRHILLDSGVLREIYTRAFYYSDHCNTQADIINGLIHDYPEEQCISRWANEADISKEDFSDLLLAVKANDLRKRIEQGNSPVTEMVKLKQQLQALQQEQRDRGRRVHDKD